MNANGATWLFVMAGLLALVLPLLKGGLKNSLRWQPTPAHIGLLKWMPPAFLALYAVFWLLKLEAASGIVYFLAGWLLSWGLGALALAPMQRGVLLMLAGFFLFPFTTAPDAVFTPLLSYLFGLTASCLAVDRTANEDGLADWAIPAVFLVGNYWVGIASQESVLARNHDMLLIFLGIALLLRTVQVLDWLPKMNHWALALVITVFGGLAGWLAVQTLLLQPSLLSWAGLFAGGVLLAYLLRPIAGEDTGNATVAQVIQLALIGIAALVASRLFGTLGWVVMAAGLLANPRLQTGLAVALAFFVGRALLQGFLHQYNPNITGINITHPYASAALYGGFITMLLVPNLLDRLNSQLSWTLVLLGVVLTAAFGHYFLHAEAMGSLLVALSVAGLGVSLLRMHQNPQPLLLAVFFINGALLTAELIGAGNTAEKSQKILVLAVALVVYALLFWFARPKPSGSKPVAVA